MLLTLSWKNIWRNPMRSGVVIASIALGLFCGVFSSAFMNGMGRQTIESAIAVELGNLQLHEPAFIDESLPEYMIPDGTRLATELSGRAGVKAVAARTRITAMVASAKTGSGAVVKGVIPDDERAISTLPEAVVDGTWFEGKGKNTIVIGKKLAEKLDVKIKSRIVLTFQDIHGELTGAAFKVVGIFKTNNSTFDENTVFVKRNELSPLIGADGIAVHEVTLLLDNYSSTDSVTTSLKKELPELSVQSWKELQPEVGMMENLMKQMLYLFVVVILVALSFGIVNTMLMAVLDRKREFGMLMAVGMSRRRIFLMVMIETVLMALTGGCIGMIAGAVTIGITSNTGIDLSSIGQGLAAMGYNTMVHPFIETSFFVGLGFMVVMTGILASLYPAMKALSLNPADAVRSE